MLSTSGRKHLCEGNARFSRFLAVFCNHYWPRKPRSLAYMVQKSLKRTLSSKWSENQNICCPSNGWLIARKCTVPRLYQDYFGTANLLWKWAFKNIQICKNMSVGQPAGVTSKYWFNQIFITNNLCKMYWFNSKSPD